jgi:hypothetical protein
MSWAEYYLWFGVVAVCAALLCGLIERGVSR